MDETRNIIMPDGDGISARMLVLDLFDTGDPQDFSVTELVRAGAAFGIEAPGIRTALTRLKSEGWVSSTARGRYTIGVNAEPLQQRILGWRTRLDDRRKWNDGWLLAVARPQERANRTVWRRTLRALELEGFTEAETNVWARPDNLAGGAAGARARLADLEAAPSLLLCEARGLDTGREELFRKLWKCDALRAAHRSLANELHRSAEGVGDMDLASAAAESLRIGREAIRRILRDPLLPEALCPTDALSELVEAMSRYEKIGKSIWRAYLAS